MEFITCRNNPEERKYVYLEGKPDKALVKLEVSDSSLANISPEANVPQDAVDKANAYFSEELLKIKQLISNLSKDPDAHHKFVEEQMDWIEHFHKIELREGTGSDEAMENSKKQVEELKEKMKLRLEILNRIEKNPGLKELFTQIEQYSRGDEGLFLKIEKIFKHEKDPKLALEKVQGEILKENMLSFASDKPARANELISYKNVLGRDQMTQICKFLNIDFASLDFSVEQLSQLDVLSLIPFKFPGLTYFEMGLLDDKGNVIKEGLEKVLVYENRDSFEQTGADGRVERLYRRLSIQSPLYLALQNVAKERYGKGELPTIKLDGHALDLNEIVEQSNKEFNDFSNAFKNNKPLEGLKGSELKDQLPRDLKDLLDYRFDEAGGIAWRIGNKLPEAIETRFKTLGLSEFNVDINEGRIRNISFRYLGETMSLSMGKYGCGENYKPYLHLYNGEQRIVSRPIEIENISLELSSLQQYKVDNQANLDEINEEYLDIKDPKKIDFFGLTGRETIFEAKETLLASIKPPNATDQKAPEAEDIKKLEKILPIILANAEVLTIHQNMTLIQAMLKIYQSPQKDAILKGNYDETKRELSNPNSRHFLGVQPHYEYKFVPNAEEGIEASRTSKKPEYVARKDQLKGVKIGQAIEVESGGKKYSFELVDRLADSEYRFVLKDFEGQRDFTVSNVDLLQHDLVDHLRLELTSSSRQSEMALDQVEKGFVTPDQVPEEMRINRRFSKGQIKADTLKAYPLDKVQKELLQDLNQNQALEVKLSTDRYGKINRFEIKWKNMDKTKFALESYSGEYWRLKVLQAEEGHTRYPFYDKKTRKVPDLIEGLQKKNKEMV